MTDVDSQNSCSSAYFLSSSETRPVPAVISGNQVEPLIDGPAFFGSLARDINRLGLAENPQENRGDFLYFSSFVLNWVQPGHTFLLPTETGCVPLIDLVVEKSRQGVDVRVLPWIPWNLALAGRIDLRPESGDNLRTVQTLRREPSMAKKACLNIIAHPGGSTHAKLIVLGGKDWSAGYTGGMDISPDRMEDRWMDVQARVEGPAVQLMYDFFRMMWNQNLAFSGMYDPRSVRRPGAVMPIPQTRRNVFRARRPVYFRTRAGSAESVVRGTPPVEKRQMVTQSPGSVQVQTLLTIPAFRFAISPLLARIRVAPIDLAPKGIFEVRDAVCEAIMSAKHYIYIEDQYLWSVEVMGWINQVVRVQPYLRVIMTTGTSDQLEERLDSYRTMAVLDGLFPGLTEDQREQIAVFQRSNMVHAKTVLVDDCWALIGSANIARRSHYMDIEHSIAFGDDPGETVREYRAKLWSTRLDVSQKQAPRLEDLTLGLNLWVRSWGTPWKGQRPKNPYRRLYREVPAVPALDREWYAMVEDPDSRQPWYFPIRRSYPKYVMK